MVTITFPDKDTEKRALAFLLGRFSGRVLRSGEHLVPEAALEALADQNIPFTVKGKTTYEQQMAAIRGAATPLNRHTETRDEHCTRGARPVRHPLGREVENAHAGG